MIYNICYIYIYIDRIPIPSKWSISFFLQIFAIARGRENFKNKNEIDHFLRAWALYSSDYVIFELILIYFFIIKYPINIHSVL